MDSDTYLSVVAVNKNRVVCLVKNDLHNSLHDGFGYIDFLGAWHIDDFMCDVVLLEEVEKSGGEIFVD